MSDTRASFMFTTGAAFILFGMGIVAFVEHQAYLAVAEFGLSGVNVGNLIFNVTRALSGSAHG